MMRSRDGRPRKSKPDHLAALWPRRYRLKSDFAMGKAYHQRVRPSDAVSVRLERGVQAPELIKQVL
jgi:hypothetical protein